ncbi:MAG: hypothetical protein KJ971_07970 [Firmicutes bacterium]|nr:hypothetical protein [Bacillota bacterium]
MKKDYWISILVLFGTIFMVYIVTRDFFLQFASNNKLLSGFIKFFFLASLGDFIGLRIKSKKWMMPSYMLVKALVWGLIGVLIVWMFVLYPAGVEALQNANLLPFKDNAFFFSLFTSILMNLTFAPVMMTFHRISDTFLNLKKQNKNASFGDTIDKINWRQFINFTFCKTIPLFWIPAHTITFLLPEEYRIIFAAILGIVLGLLLSLFTNKKKEVILK